MSIRRQLSASKDRWDSRFAAQRRADTEFEQKQSEAHAGVHWNALVRHLETSEYLTVVILPLFRAFAAAARQSKYGARVVHRAHAAKCRDGLKVEYTSSVQMVLTRKSPHSSGSFLIRGTPDGQYKLTTFCPGHVKVCRTEDADDLSPERVAELLDEFLERVLGLEQAKP